MSATLTEPWGRIDALKLALPNGHDVHYSTQDGVTHLTQGETPGGGTSEGGFLLISLDVDGEGFSRVDVDAPAGWGLDSAKSPTAIVGRAADYLTALHAKLQQIEALEVSA